MHHTDEVCTTVSGNTDPIASGRPVSPSQQAISTSRSPRLRSCVRTDCQNFAPLRVGDPHAQDVLAALHIDTHDQVGGLHRDHTPVLDPDPDRVHVQDRVDVVDGSVLPRDDLVRDHVGDLGNELRDADTPYTSARCASISRVDIPRAYNDMIISSICPSRRERFGTIRGSKPPFRSRGTTIVTGPTVVATVFTP